MSGQTTDPFVFGQNDRAEAEDIIERLSLSPHPEGGFYRETFRHQPVHGRRGALTVIYYLLRAGERSAWHRIDAVEVWHHYAGAPLRLSLSEDGVGVRSFTLGKDLVAGQQLHAVVQAHVWQSAESLGRWTLVGCTVARERLIRASAPPGRYGDRQADLRFASPGIARFDLTG